MRYALPLLLLLQACGPTPVPDTSAPVAEGPLSRLERMADGLVGAWVDTNANGRTVFHEQWERSADTLYTGLGFVMSGNDTVHIEHLRIHWDRSNGWYSARIPSQNEGAFVDFKLVHASSDSLVFTNPDHDFPQRIRYARDASGAWDVEVSALVNDTLRAQQFRLRARGRAPASEMP